MRVLFSTEPATGLLNHLSVVEELSARGHEVKIVVHGRRDAAAVERLSELSGVSIEDAPLLAGGRAWAWMSLAADVRSSLDFLAFSDERFNETYRARARRRVPGPMLALAPLLRARVLRRLLRRALELVGRAIPTDPALVRYLRDERPDVLLLTPYVGLRTEQYHLLRAAEAVGVHTAVCVKSWDNLTSKSALRPVPERVVVWNETQREEARELHGIDPATVVVTGAQCFDVWLDARPRSRAELAASTGLDLSGPLILYTCCAPWTGQSELPFVRRWLSALRAADEETLARAAVLVRPHPKRPDEVGLQDLDGLGPVAVWPSHGAVPVDGDALQDYLDSLAHAAAVVGLNTTAMVEAALFRKPVLTVLDPEYRMVQQGTLHFRYLLEVGGGMLDVARTVDEHVAQLTIALREPARGEARADAFATAFLRPFGREVAATPVFVDAVEELAASPPPAPSRPGAVAGALRPLLAPLARRAGRYDDPEAPPRRPSRRRQRA